MTLIFYWCSYPVNAYEVIYYYILFICLLFCVEGRCMWRLLVGVYISPSTTWGLGTKLWPVGWQLVPLPTELSGQPDPVSVLSLLSPKKFPGEELKERRQAFPSSQSQDKGGYSEVHFGPFLQSCSFKRQVLTLTTGLLMREYYLFPLLSCFQPCFHDCWQPGHGSLHRIIATRQRQPCNPFSLLLGKKIFLSLKI